MSKKDEVILSSQAQEVGQLYQAIRALPEVREDRVREISAKIAQGTYDVDAQAVAEKMLAHKNIDIELYYLRPDISSRNRSSGEKNPSNFYLQEVPVFSSVLHMIQTIS